MTDVSTAGAVYEVGLEVHRRSWWRRLGVTIYVALSALSMGYLGMPSAGEVVVRRRADGVEVLRTDAEAEEGTAYVLAHVREQLATLSVAEFQQAWGIGPADR